MLANLQPSQDQSQEIPESQESSELERKWAWGSAEATTPLLWEPSWKTRFVFQETVMAGALPGELRANQMYAGLEAFMRLQR